MFKPIKGGTVEKVQGVKCQLPPQPPDAEILNFYLPRSDQYWHRTLLPTLPTKEVEIWSGDFYENDILDWETARREETIKQTGRDPWNLDNRGAPKLVAGVEEDEFYINPALEEFRIQELDRIEKGIWFFNNGKAIYIPGSYYFYLNWWRLNTGYPEFRDPDRTLFYFWEHIKHNPDCYGLLEITKRGIGKSFRAGCVAYLECTLYRHAHVGIQSKTDDDAEEFFLSKVVEPMKDLPDFLVPTNNHGTEPKTELSFFPSATRSKHAAIHRKNKRALRSKMTFRNAGEKAYDSTTLKFLVQDEIAKLDPKLSNAKKRLGVNRQCVYRDSKMVGKMWCTTTVEDMAKGGDVCKEIWYDSDRSPDKMSAIGRTVSGLFQYFTSTLDISYFNKFGYPDRARARHEHDAERANKEGDPLEYVGYIQRNPYSIEEAFMTSGKECIYNAKVLQERQMFLQQPRNKSTTRGDFHWENGIEDSRVIWGANEENGRWEVSWLFPSPASSNNIDERKDFKGFRQFSPRNDVRFGFAYDPYSHTQTVDLRKSNAAGAVYRNFEAFDPDYSDTFIADYVGRPEDPDEASEDILMACVYYSCGVLIENNKNDPIKYFKKRGYYDFIIVRPEETLTATGAAAARQQTDGIPATTPVIEYYIKRMKHHVTTLGYKLKHLRIVKDLLDFDPKKRTKYDLAVASQLALLSAEREVPQEEPSVDAGMLLESWDNSGTHGEVVNYQ